MKEKIFIEGGKRLSGSIPISGAKNSCLTLMPASLLSEGALTLNNVPNLTDVDTMKELLESLGCVVRHQRADKTLYLKHSDKCLFLADYEIVKMMRASILVLGPLLARFGQAVVALPGGCAIGARPVNLHLMALEALGASFSIENGYVKGNVAKSLKGCKIKFPFESVGAKRLEDRRLHKATFARKVQIHLVIPILILYLCRVQITNVPQAEVMTRR